MSKVTVVGAGAVGATCADVLARHEVANHVVLLDIKDGFAQGKALDQFQCSPIDLFDTRLSGSTNDYALTAGSDVVVITSGIPRKPGMTREELIGTNAGIVKAVVENVLAHSPNAIILVVTNPLDTMTYYALKLSKLAKNRVFGMGALLDSSRYKTFISLATGRSPKDIQGLVIGGHGDTTMVPLPRFTSISGMPLDMFLNAEQIEALVNRTMKGGAELTALIGTSAWYAPGAAAAKTVESILRDQKRILPSCVYLEGEYGQQDICLNVPVIIGREGVEQVIQLPLNEAEQAKFDASAKAVREVNSVLTF
jgi:malate dehydrogenase